jgi:hypothetical protein
MAVTERAFICCNPNNYLSCSQQSGQIASAAVAKASSSNEHSALWENGKDIKVLFINGSDLLKNRVLKIANQWTEFANLGFVKVDHPPAEIRIAFDHQGVSYSFVGNEALTFSDQTKPTMKFGWIDESTPEQELRRVILHEFGHAIGLQHEHQSPDSNIQWDHEKVFAYFKNKLLSPNGKNWQDEKEYRDYVERNVIQKFAKSDVRNSCFDQNSIMLYTFPASLTVNGIGTKQNYDLSDLDKSFIGIQYPGLSSIRYWYQKYLGRQADHQGLQHWRKELVHKGVDYVENWIKNSDEAKDLIHRPLIKQFYLEILQREPDLDGMNHWLSVARNQGINSAKVLIEHSEEAKNIKNRLLIRNFYLQFLQREPEPAGMDHWLSVARNQGIDSAKAQIEHSEEAKRVRNRATIESYYRTYLGRGSDPSGMEHWLGVASCKGLAIVEDWIKNSPEAKNRR